jgi:trigger factor
LTGRAGLLDRDATIAVGEGRLGFLNFWGEPPMTDEPLPADPESAGTATAEPAGEKKEDKKEDKLNQTVEISDIGPCKKHIKVAVDRGDIDKLLDEKFSELVKEAVVPGFRPGKAPRKVITRKFHREVTEQVRGQLLLASLEQLAEDHDIAPLSTPEIDPDTIFIPQEGPFIYEFDVEVRPEFDLPNYKGLKLKRPVRTFSDTDVAKEERRILSRYGQMVPKEDGAAEVEDYLTVDMETRIGGRVIGTMKEVVLRVDDQLVFKDGIAERFGEQTRGAKAGDQREIDITLSDAAASPELRGQSVQANLSIKDVKTIRLPELTHDFLHMFGVHSEDQFHERVRVLLEKRLEYQQRQSAREQVLGQIASASSWELPRDLLMRQARKHLARKVMEMKEAGMTDEEIQGRQRLLQQDVLSSTAMALKEHFVLQKIAEVEKIEVSDDEINDEIERLADLEKESPRRVRARLEKEDLIEMLAAQIVERKALDLVLDNAEYEDVPLEAKPTAAVSTVEAQAVPGELHDPTAMPESPGEGSEQESK